MKAEDILSKYGQYKAEGLGSLLDAARKESGLNAEQFGKALGALESLLYPALERAGMREDRFFDGLMDHATDYRANLDDEMVRQQPEPPPPVAEPPKQRELAPDKAARLAEFKDEHSETFKRWQAGDEKLNEERQALYGEAYPQSIEIR